MAACLRLQPTWADPGRSPAPRPLLPPWSSTGCSSSGASDSRTGTGGAGVGCRSRGLSPGGGCGLRPGLCFGRGWAPSNPLRQSVQPTACSPPDPTPSNPRNGGPGAATPSAGAQRPVEAPPCPPASPLSRQLGTGGPPSPGPAWGSRPPASPGRSCPEGRPAVRGQARQSGPCCPREPGLSSPASAVDQLWGGT